MTSDCVLPAFLRIIDSSVAGSRELFNTFLKVLLFLRLAISMTSFIRSHYKCVVIIHLLFEEAVKTAFGNNELES